MNIFCDFETRSTLDIRLVGTPAYAEHPSTDVQCLAVVRDDGEYLVWIPERYVDCMILAPELRMTTGTNTLFVWLEKADQVEAHNASFERAIWRSIMHKRYRWPLIPEEKWACSAAKAAAFTIPRSLDGAGMAMGLDVRKNLEGKKIMLKMCRPLPAKKGREGVCWWEDSQDVVKLIRYCLQDVFAEIALSDALPRLSGEEDYNWHLDQEVNSRGVLVDMQTVDAMVKMVEEHEDGLKREVEDIAQGRLKTVKQVELMKEVCGVADLQKATVSTALETETDPLKKRLLEIRQSLGKSSVTKYRAFQNRVSSDNRLRDLVMYHAASTGRFAGKGVQVQNFPRAHMTPAETEHAISLVREGNSLDLELMYGDIMTVAQKLLRPMFIAPPGKVLVCADYASIEAHVLMWLAGEEEACEAFRNGADLYCEIASVIFGFLVTKSNPTERFVGKTSILGQGYGMGARKFRDTCKNQGGVDISIKLARKTTRTYRKRFEGVPQLWYGTEAAAIETVQSGLPHSCSKFAFGMWRGHLRCRLPSGRLLTYPYPEIHSERAWVYKAVDDENNVSNIMVGGKNAGEALKQARKNAEAEELIIVSDGKETLKTFLTFMGADSKTKRWKRERTFGGRLVENIDQAISRDLLVAGIDRVQKHGHEVVMHVHDEIVAEYPEEMVKDALNKKGVLEYGLGTVKEFEALMSTLPEWAEGCPVDAEGWIGKRYRK